MNNSNEKRTLETINQTTAITLSWIIPLAVPFLIISGALLIWIHSLG